MSETTYLVLPVHRLSCAFREGEILSVESPNTKVASLLIPRPVKQKHKNTRTPEKQPHTFSAHVLTWSCKERVIMWPMLSSLQWTSSLRSLPRDPMSYC